MDLSCITISYSLAVQTYNGIFINGCCRHTVAADSAARDTVRVAPLRGSYAQMRERQKQGIRSTQGGGVRLSAAFGLHGVLEREKGRNVPEPAYYYHTDHLGSTTLLTDSTGRVVQTISYLPYGEEWTEYNDLQRPDSLSLGQYRFNGKERDPETGFLYYSQRYYGIPYLPTWLSVDPMLDKYPGISPYAYCLWNPVRFVDPDGREIDDYYNLSGELIKHTNEGNNKYLVLTSGQDVEMDKVIAVPTQRTLDKMESLFSSKVEKGIAVGINGESSMVITGTTDYISTAQWEPALREILEDGGTIDYLVHLHPLNLEEMSGGSPNPSEIDRNQSNFFNSMLGIILSYQQTMDMNRHGMSLDKRDYVPTISFYNSSSSEAVHKMGFRAFKSLISKINRQ